MKKQRYIADVDTTSGLPQRTINILNNNFRTLESIASEPLMLEDRAEQEGMSPVAFSGKYSDLTGKPDLGSFVTEDELATVALTGDYDDLEDTPDISGFVEADDLATVATTGNYNDLLNKPTIPPGVQVDSSLSGMSTNPVQNKVIKSALDEKADSSSLATVATSGSYNDLTDTPTSTVVGKNLLKFTTEPKSLGNNSTSRLLSGWCSYNSDLSISYTNEGIKGSFVGSSYTGFVIPFIYDDAVNTEEVVLSFDYRTNATSFGTHVFYLCWTSPNVSRTITFTPTASETTWQHAEIKFSMPTHGDRKAYALLFPYSNLNGKWIEIRNKSMKLEVGGTATEWVPACGDETGAISLETGTDNGAVLSTVVGSQENVYVKGFENGYLLTHPEFNKPCIIPFMHNDIAFLLSRGGSAKLYFDGVEQSMNIANAFDGSPSYVGFNSSTHSVTEMVIELTLHKTFTWKNTLYIDFGPWYTKAVKVEVMNTSTSYQDVWTTKLDTTTNTSPRVIVNVTHTPVGASSSGGGFNKVRITFANVWVGYSSTQFRIAQIGIYNYSSLGLRETSMSRGIDDFVYRSITPGLDGNYHLGSSSNRWNTVYAYKSTISKILNRITIGNHTTTSIGDAGIAVNDVRDATITNNAIDRAANFFFTNSGTPDTKFWSILHVKGWTGAYAAWELAGTASTESDTSTKPLYVRTGSSSNTWGNWRKIYDAENPPAATELTGILPATKGGTGETTLADSANALINALSAGSSNITDDDTAIVCQNVDTTLTTYFRRPVSKLWSYIKSKADAVYPLLAGGTALASTDNLDNIKDAGTYNVTSPSNTPINAPISDFVGKVIVQIPHASSSEIIAQKAVYYYSGLEYWRTYQDGSWSGWYKRGAGTLPTSAANQVLATPNGSTGWAVFRSLVNADLPTVNASHGGTGQTSLNGSMNALIGALTVATATPTDDMYVISESSTGGTGNYFRRKISTIWPWIRSKFAPATYNVKSLITQTTAQAGNFTISAATLAVSGFVAQLSIDFTIGTALAANTEYSLGTLPASIRPVIRANAGIGDQRFWAAIANGVLYLRPYAAVTASTTATYRYNSTYILESYYSG